MVLLGIAVAIPVNVVSSYLPPTVTDHKVAWVVLLSGAALAMVVLTWLSGRASGSALRGRLPRAWLMPGWVDREELGEVVRLLTARDARTVGITAMAALAGAGGFGKTTLARMACADPRIRKRFPGGSLWMTIGQGVRGASLAEKINDTAALLGGDRPGYADPEIAGQHLMAMLDAGPRRLLVVDDVWSAEQLDPFRTGGSRCAVLVTTRLPDVLPGDAHRVLVDQMSPDQARQMITGEGFTLPKGTVEDLVRVCGQWPLLLSLAVGRMRAVAGHGDVTAAAQQDIEKMTSYGPAALDVTVSGDRTRAVTVNMGLSLDLLPAGGRDRFAELAIFTAETPVPVSVVARLWAATAGMSEMDSHALCQSLGQLSLARSNADTDTVELHEVTRAYLQAILGPRVPGLHAVMIDSLAAALPTAGALDGDHGPVVVAWWELPGDGAYLWDNLARHLAGAGRPGEDDRAITDLRWVAARLIRSGPAAPLADLSRCGTDRAMALCWELTRAEHLLIPTVPARSVADVLLSRLRDDSMWRDEVDRFVAALTAPHLINRWPLPDVSDERLRRTLAGHSDWVTSVAVSPDGTWLASGSLDGTIGIWDAATGRRRSTLTGHGGGVVALAVSPDGTWLASTDGTTTVYLWDLITGKVRTSFDAARSEGDRLRWVTTLAASPDSTWLATANLAGTAGQWDSATGLPRTPHAGGWRATSSVAISPDGRWLATASGTGPRQYVFIWDTATGEEHHTVVTDHDRDLAFVTFSPDGTWLATASSGDNQVKLWDAATGQPRLCVPTQHSGVCGLAVSPDGTWLATTGADLDSTIQFWDSRTGEHLASLGGESLRVLSVAISPDGTWVAAADQDSSVRIWDLALTPSTARTHGSGLFAPVAISPGGTWLAGATDKDRIIRVRDILTGFQRHAFILPVGSADRAAISPDGTWLAILGSGRPNIWDITTGQPRPAPHTNDARAIAISPSGTWLATGHQEGQVRLWDAATGQPRHGFHTEPSRAPSAFRNDVTSISISPDGTWLATTTNLDDTVHIWGTAAGEFRHTLVSQHFVQIAAIAPDGTWLATGDQQGEVRIWEAADGRLRAALNVLDEASAASTDTVESVTISVDSTWLATTATDDSRVQIWDSATGHHRATLTHGNRVARAVAVSSDGAWLATASGGAVFTDPYTVMIWSVATWECVASTRVNGRLDSCSWTLDGDRIVLTGAFGVYVFDFHPGDTPSVSASGTSPQQISRGTAKLQAAREAALVRQDLERAASLRELEKYIMTHDPMRATGQSDHTSPS
jgi:WD40 repeat protein